LDCDNRQESPNSNILILVNDEIFVRSHWIPLIRTLQKQAKQVTLYTKTRGENLNEALPEGVTIVESHLSRNNTSPFDFLHQLMQLRRCYREIRPELVVAIGIQSILTWGFAFPLMRPKIIMLVTGLGALFTLPNLAIRLLFQRALVQTSLYFILRRSQSMVVVESNSLCSRLSSMFRLTQKSISVIPGAGVDTDVFVRRQDARNQSERLRVTFIGRLTEDKGFQDFMMVAMALARRASSFCEFVAAGTLDTESPRCIAKVDLDSVVSTAALKYLGQVEDVKTVLQDTDVLLFPSRGEGLPKAVLEAMSMECTVIAYDVVGCRDLIQSGYNGFLIPALRPDLMEQKILAIEKQRELMVEIGKNARKLVERYYSIQSFEKSFGSLVESCASQPN
jgi:glycosyltransferase involved in cell wall biosynthesis